MTEKMPALFLGHGSPMNALERNRYSEAWRLLGESLPRPRAIVVISAHWYVNATAVTGMAKPRTIHDFYGFPQALFDVRYPAPGDPELAENIAGMLGIGVDHDSWGIDHGAWSLLVHLFPEADVPVLQLSINALKPFDYHVELGARLAPLREKGVLVLASGNIVHNLRRIEWREPDAGAEWNVRFDQAVRDVMTNAPGDIESTTRHPDYAAAVPSPDHFVPLLYLAGLAKAAGEPANPLFEGYAMSSLSMTSYAVGAAPEVHMDMANALSAFPAGDGEQTNL